jgi:hypothetical protein
VTNTWFFTAEDAVQRRQRQCITTSPTAAASSRRRRRPHRPARPTASDHPWPMDWVGGRAGPAADYRASLSRAVSDLYDCRYGEDEASSSELHVVAWRHLPIRGRKPCCVASTWPEVAARGLSTTSAGDPLSSTTPSTTGPAEREAAAAGVAVKAGRARCGRRSGGVSAADIQAGNPHLE